MHSLTSFTLPPLWKKNPFIRIAICYIIGICIQKKAELPLAILLSLLVTGFLPVLIWRWLPVKISFLLRHVRGLLLTIVVVLFAMLNVWLKSDKNKPNHYSHLYKKGDGLLLEINSEPVVTENQSKAIAKVTALCQAGKMVFTTGNVQLYFTRRDSIHSLHYGSRILTASPLQPIVSNNNPGGFDFREYSSNKQIFHSISIKNNGALLPESGGNPLMKWVLKTRRQLLDLLQEKFQVHQAELGIAEALLIGYSTDVDKELQQAYSRTGVVHIIAISGMHLALIYVLLVFVFSKTPLIGTRPLWQLIAVLSILWLFSLLTGASASVCRAALMFSFISLGKHLNRTASIYNALAASAFLLLWHDPANLKDVGFQLSYLAVLSIVVFQKPIQNWLNIKINWLQKIWELAAVSIAAQILTFPICIYYFHQFPNLFLIANMVAVPLSSFILYLLIALVALSQWTAVATILTTGIVFLIAQLNRFILFLETLPFAMLENIPFDLFSAFLFYAAIASFAAWLFTKSNTARLLSFVLFTAIICNRSFNQIIAQKQCHLIFYHSPKQSVMEYICGKKYGLLIDNRPPTQNDADHYKKYVNSANGQFQAEVANSMLIRRPKKNLSLFLLGNRLLLSADSSQRFLPQKNKIILDWLVVSKNNLPDFENLLRTFEIRWVIFDATNTLWKIAQKEKECDALHLRHYNIRTEGAFIQTLSFN